MKACVEDRWGSPSLQGRRVAVQGLGAVGWPMVEYLVAEGANVVVSDISSLRVDAAAATFGVESVAAEAIVDADVDVYCPCALGAVINDESTHRLQASIVCGSANNQLHEPRHGDALQARGVLYAPDYIANAGGTVFDTDRLWGGVNKERGMAKVGQIYERMHEVIAIARRDEVPTYIAADRLAEARIAGYRSIKRIHGFDQGSQLSY